MSSPPTTTPPPGSFRGWFAPTTTAASASSGSCPASRTVPTSTWAWASGPGGTAFEGVEFAPGEVRDLGICGSSRRSPRAEGMNPSVTEPQVAATSSRSPMKGSAVFSDQTGRSMPA